MKRLFDILLSGTGLLVSSPLWLGIAMAIKLEDGGPVFFTQRRVGLGGHPFRVFKFRSMKVHQEAVMRAATDNDPRVTRVGRVLRNSAMDELPQLWNIFRGDMSFVGPRALAENEIEVGGDGQPRRLEDVPGYHERHQVPPGLTGLTQVFASRDLRREGKFRLDRLYVKNASFWLDLRLVALSFWITFRGRWEAKGSKL
jgi:lipopolysaccharide/colanic/teichoic acid biosynthesis glycosyltransferase